MPASTITPSAYPLVFTELVVFYRDVPPLAMPGGLTQLPPPGTSFARVLAKGIAYSHVRKRLIVSLVQQGTGTKTGVLKEINIHTGVREWFATALQLQASVESKIAIVPTTGPGGFTSGNLYVGSGPTSGTGNQIAKVSPNGTTVTDPWVTPDAAPSYGLWGGLTFDHPSGAFGGELIALTLGERGGGTNTPPKLFRISNAGTVTLIASLSGAMAVGNHVEGVVVAPSTFGTHAGQIIIGSEGTNNTNGGEIYAVTAAPAKTLLADLYSMAEELRFVPPNGGTFYLAQIDFHRETGNRVLTATSSQFLAHRGKLIALNELSSELWAITWTGSAYTQQLIGVVRDRWTTEGVNTQGTELEQSCFADLAPTVPTGWNSWTEISSGGSAFTTDQHVAAATQGDTVCVAARSNGGNYTAGVIYVNRYTISTGLWSGWQPLANIPTGVGTTVLAPAIAMQDTNQVHVFAVEQSTNKLYQNWGGLSGSSWFEVSSMTTTQSPAAALINGAVTVCVHSNVTGGQRICELRPTGEPPWGPVINLPEADQSDYAPAIAQFQNELWVFTLASTKVYARARTASGQWTEKGEIPGGGSTSVSVGAAGTPALVQAQLPHSKQMFLFARGVPNNYHYINVASETGTWSGWSTIDTVGTTDKPDAACVTDSSSPQLYLFARGIGDQRVYWRRTAVAT